MTWFIDRRLNGKNKSTVNRQRFLRRYKAQIKQSISEAINKRSVTDVDSGESVSIPTDDISEPMFHQGRGGLRHRVHPGNDHFVQNDRIERPQGGGGGSGSGQGQASQDGEGQDEFVFQISKDEYLDLLFEDLALPNLKKNQHRQLNEYPSRGLYRQRRARQYQRRAFVAELAGATHGHDGRQTSRTARAGEQPEGGGKHGTGATAGRGAPA
jgi:uncharacterized sporulation protein YeaH/YhbH (DUF444 family)